MTTPVTTVDKLLISGQSTTWEMNVIAFSAPVYGQINTAQTASEAVHFPIKMSQPGLQLDVQFRNEIEFQNFQTFVRNHQKQISTIPSALLTLSWPSRYINNFTGFITKFEAGGMRANYTPRSRFVVTLVDSYVTSRTEMASIAANWQSIYGGIGLPNGVLAPPTVAQLQLGAITLPIPTANNSPGVVTGSS